MEVNTLDQLIRSEPTAAANNRRASDPGSKPFSSLLDSNAERARPERSAPVAKAANGPSVKTRKTESDDAPEKPARAEAKEVPAPKERAGRDEKTHAADKPERAAAPAKSQKTETADGAKEDAAKPDAAASSAENTDGNAQADDNTQTDDSDAAAAAAAARLADASAIVAADPALSDAIPIAATPVATAAAQTADPLQAIAVAVAPVLETQETAKAAPTPTAAASAAPAIGAPLQTDVKQPETQAAAVPVQELAKPTSTLSEQADAADANSSEDYADFMLRNMAASPAAAATAEKDAAKPDSKAKETTWSVTIAPSAMATAPVAPTTALAVQAAADADGTAIDANATKAPVAAAIDADDAKPIAKNPDAAAQFAQHLDPARDARSAEEVRAPGRPTAAPAHEQVAVQVRKAVAEGLDQITIRLNPLELGRIDVKIEVGNDGSLRAAFAADKQMTLDLLKGDSRQLEQSLKEAGLSTDAGGLNFSLRGDNRENAQAFRQLGEEFARKRADDGTANEAQAPLAAGSYARRNAGPGRIDLNA